MPVKFAICSPSLQLHPQSGSLLPLQAQFTQPSRFCFFSRTPYALLPNTDFLLKHTMTLFYIIHIRSSTSSSPYNTAIIYLSKFYLLLFSKMHHATPTSKSVCFSSLLYLPFTPVFYNLPRKNSEPRLMKYMGSKENCQERTMALHL